ncbi:MAG: putative nucleic acid-binding protein containing domain [Segetibacter sp.]|nr:putative nucleic acid-binding protein containing domain [Segetibacter sp.]
MFTNNRIFIDSSILVEALKGNKVSFYRNLISDIKNQNFINETVISEYLYFVLGFNGGASPRTLKEKGQINEVLSLDQNLTSILTDFFFLNGDSSLLNQVPYFMRTYNLLPNDAIILATCKIHNITKLASHDSDFILPCKTEGIELLREE